MKKIVIYYFLITGLFALSCNNKASSTSSIGKVGEITVNPYGVTPLSAVYTTATVNATPITVTVKGLYSEPDIIHTYPAGYGTEFEIHGMFPESQNTIEVNDGGRIITKNEYVGSISFNGVGIPTKFTVELDNLPEEKYPNNPDMYFTTILANNLWATISISRNGYVRYLNTLSYASKILPENGKIMFYSVYDDSGVYNLVGKKYVAFPSNAHHDTIKKGNNYLYLSYSTWGSEDSLTEVDSSGKVIKVLRFADIIKDLIKVNNIQDEINTMNKIVFDEDNKHIKNGVAVSADWFHGNSIVYDSSTDILYVSSRHRGVLAIDYSEWKLIWWMANNNLQTQVADAYSCIPYDFHLRDLPSLETYQVKLDGAIDGPKNQHALFLLPNGNLGMFDNYGDNYISADPSRYVEYKIYKQNGNYVATKVQEYKNTSLYSRTRSDVDFVGENYNNLLLTYGDQVGIILEIDMDNNELFKINLGKSWGLYRSDKMPFYYDEGRVYSEDYNLKN